MFNSEPVYNDKYIKIKIKIYNNKVYIKYQYKVTKDNECCTCLSEILLDSVVKTEHEYYSQIFLEERKYTIKKQPKR